jgi:hypothetical protein
MPSLTYMMFDLSSSSGDNDNTWLSVIRLVRVGPGTELLHHRVRMDGRHQQPGE